MKSFQLFPRLLTILSSFCVMMVTPMFTTDNTVSYFAAIFDTPKNVFNSVYLTYSQSHTQLSEICKYLNKGTEMILDRREIVNVALPALPKQRFNNIRLIKVPAFHCTKDGPFDEKDVMYVYSVTERETRFFKLNEAESNTDDKKIYHVVDSRSTSNKAFYMRLGELEGEIYAYLNSKPYKSKARKSFDEYQQDGAYWLELCKMYFLHVVTIKPPTGDGVHIVKTIIYEDRDPIEIPLLSCPISNPDTLGYIAVYKRDFKFGVEGPTNATARVNYDLLNLYLTEKSDSE